MKKFGLWLVVLGVVACDIPTELPILEPRLVFEAERSTITADQLLPANVTVQGNSFLVTFTTATVTRTLGEACPSCAQFNGQTAPKPAFTAAFPPATVSLPTGVRSATLSNNVLNLQVFNGLSFYRCGQVQRRAVPLPFGSHTPGPCWLILCFPDRTLRCLQVKTPRFRFLSDRLR